MNRPAQPHRLPQLTDEVAALETKVSRHLARMGFKA